MDPEHCTSNDQVFEIKDVMCLCDLSYSVICQSCLPVRYPILTEDSLMPELQQHDCYISAGGDAGLNVVTLPFFDK